MVFNTNTATKSYSSLRAIFTYLLFPISSTSCLQTTGIPIQNTISINNFTSSINLLPNTPAGSFLNKKGKNNPFTNSPLTHLKKENIKKYAPQISLKHSKAIRAKKNLIEKWYRQSKIKKILPLELEQLIINYVGIDKINLIFSLKNKTINANNQIKIINSYSNIFRLITINKINNNHSLNKFHTYLATLNKIINYNRLFLQIDNNTINENEIELTLNKSVYILSSIGIYENIRYDVINDLNKIINKLNKEIRLNERLYKIEKVWSASCEVLFKIHHFICKTFFNGFMNSK